MKALPTQFDDQNLSGTVATPTCGGCCCCCCCCLATTIASTSLLTQRIAKDTQKNNIANRGLLITLAVLIWPITILVSSMVNYIDSLISNISKNSLILNVQSNLFLGILTPFILLLIVLRYLYGQVHVNKPLKRAILVTVLISVAFVLEFFGGGFLVITGVGGIGYLLMVPAIVGSISAWYHRHIGNEINDNVALAATIQPAYPPAENNTSVEQHVESSTKPDETTPTPQEPPQPNPPAPGSQ